MRRTVLLLALLALAVAAGVTAVPASATSPCRDRIYADWYADGKIASTYPLACYRDALKHAEGRADIGVYSSMLDDIRLALQAAVKRSQGQDVPSQVGGSAPVSATSPTATTSSPGTTTSSASTNPHMPADTAPSAPDPGVMTTANATASQSTSGGGVPVPLLVLGGVAILLVASGAIGLGVKRFRRG
ncbi:MAG TPA: hypothetical protein VLK36_04765 [Gaiellaceae bacterium]|nr:hypothetical protein [Gaiellaceae bacterium]